MNKKLSIIVPYRDRKEHLEKFLETIPKFIKNIDTSIIIVNQNNKLLFNRGLLMNVGVVLSHLHSDYFCLHDVDLMPMDQSCDYSFLKGVSRIATYLSCFNFIERTANEIGGGVALIDKESFFKINGYSNEYFGWGAEDNDFSNRLRRENIRYTKRFGKYYAIPHKKEEKEKIEEWSQTNGVNDFVWHNRRLLSIKKEDKQSHINDGLNSLHIFNTNIVNITKYKNYIFCNVNFDGGDIYKEVLSCNKKNK